MCDFVSGEWRTFTGTHEYEACFIDGKLEYIDIIEHGTWARFAPEQARHLIPAAVFSSIIERGEGNEA